MKQALRLLHTANFTSYIPNKEAEDKMKGNL